MKIAKPPKILIISLQRKNTILNSKNECMIYFNEEIDLSDYIDLDLIQNQILSISCKGLLIIEIL